VHRQKTAAGGTEHSGSNGKDAVEIPAGERDLVDALGIDVAVKLVGELDQGSCSFDEARLLRKTASPGSW